MIPRTLLLCLTALLAPMIAAAEASTSPPRAESTRSVAAVRNFVLISQAASGWRQFLPRLAPVFKTGEAIQFYAEPVSLGWRSTASGFRFELHVDVEIRTTDGRMLWGQKDYGRLVRDSESADPNTYITGAVAVEGLQPGVYVLGIRLRDPSNRISAESETMFAILAEPRRIDA